MVIIIIGQVVEEVAAIMKQMVMVVSVAVEVQLTTLLLQLKLMELVVAVL
jgi:hypothetical protein